MNWRNLYLEARKEEEIGSFFASTLPIEQLLSKMIDEKKDEEILEMFDLIEEDLDDFSVSIIVDLISLFFQSGYWIREKKPKKIMKFIPLPFYDALIRKIVSEGEIEDAERILFLQDEKTVDRDLIDDLVFFETKKIDLFLFLYRKIQPSSQIKMIRRYIRRAVRNGDEEAIKFAKQIVKKTGVNGKEVKYEAIEDFLSLSNPGFY